MSPSPEVKSSLLRQIQAAPSPTRSALRRRAVALLGFTLLCWVAAAWELGLGLERPLGYLVVTLVGWALIGAASSLISIAPGKMLGLPSSYLRMVVVAAPLLLTVLSLANQLWSGLPDQCPGVSPIGARCRDIILGLAGIPLVLELLRRRGSDPVHPGWAGAALGVSAGAWAGLVISLSC